MGSLNCFAWPGSCLFCLSSVLLPPISPPRVPEHSTLRISPPICLANLQSSPGRRIQFYCYFLCKAFPNHFGLQTSWVLYPFLFSWCAKSHLQLRITQVNCLTSSSLDYTRYEDRDLFLSCSLSCLLGFNTMPGT